MGKAIKIDGLDKKLLKAVKKAVDKKAAKEIVPIVKQAYKEGADYQFKKTKAKSSAVKANNDAVKNAIENISHSIQKSPQNTEPVDGSFIVFNGVEPQDPLWGEIHSSEPLYDVFAKWVVNGDLVIHPALTDYKNKNVNDDIGWDNYVKDYRIKAAPFIDEAEKRLHRKKNWNKVVKIVQDTVMDEVKKSLK